MPLCHLNNLLGFSPSMTSVEHGHIRFQYLTCILNKIFPISNYVPIPDLETGREATCDTIFQERRELQYSQMAIIVYLVLGLKKLSMSDGLRHDGLQMSTISRNFFIKFHLCSPLTTPHNFFLLLTIIQLLVAK